MMYALLVFLLLVIPIFNVFTSSLLSETNNEVEKITKNIERQELVNQGLSMQIDELASLENIQSIAEIMDYRIIIVILNQSENKRR